MRTSRAEAMAAPIDITRREEISESRPETTPPSSDASPEASTKPARPLKESLPTECDKATMKEVDSADTSINERTMTKSRNWVSLKKSAQVSFHHRTCSRGSAFAERSLLDGCSFGSMMPEKTTDATEIGRAHV